MTQQPIPTEQPAPRRREFRTVTVKTVERLTPRLVRVTLAGETLATMTTRGPAEHLKVLFPAPGQTQPAVPSFDDEGRPVYPPGVERPVSRTYTPRRFRPDAGELDIDFVLHPEHVGPASEWASQAIPGDEIGFLCPPHALYCPQPDAAWQLLVGDESAIPAIGAIIEQLDEGQSAHAFIEVPGPEEEQRFDTRGDVRVHWIHRGTRPHGDAIVAAVRAAELPGGAPYAWISGEATLVKLTRRNLVRERGIDKHAITFTGYWRQGRTEEDNGRESVRRAAAGEPVVDED